MFLFVWQIVPNETHCSQFRFNLNLPWLPSCLDRGTLINVDASGCGTYVVRGSSRKVFLSWGTVVPKGFLAESAYFSSRT